MTSKGTHVNKEPITKKCKVMHTNYFLNFKTALYFSVLAKRIEESGLN